MTGAPADGAAHPRMSFGAALGLALLVIATVGVIATVREMAVGRGAIAAADAAAHRLDWPEAIRHARAAAKASAPASPWPERGQQRLEAIGNDAEKRGDVETALLAYGAMRSAALATRVPGRDNARRRAEAEAGLARVAGWAFAGGTGPSRGSKPNDAVPSMRDALAQESMPSSWTFAALGASAITLLAAVAWLAWRGTSDHYAHIAESLIATALVTYASVLLAN